MMLRFLPAIVAAILLGFLGLASLQKDSAQDNPFTSRLIGQEIPADDKNTLTSQIFDTDKVTIVNFFASWCVPCRIEHPQLTHIKNTQDVQLIGIAFKDTTQNIDKFLTDLGDPYDVVVQDPDGLIGLTWGIHGAPETFIIDKKNIIRYNHAGPLMPDNLIGFIPKIGRYK